MSITRVCADEGLSETESSEEGVFACCGGGAATRVDKASGVTLWPVTSSMLLWARGALLGLALETFHFSFSFCIAARVVIVVMPWFLALHSIADVRSCEYSGSPCHFELIIFCSLLNLSEDSPVIKVINLILLCMFFLHRM